MTTDLKQNVGMSVAISLIGVIGGLIVAGVIDLRSTITSIGKDIEVVENGLNGVEIKIAEFSVMLGNLPPKAAQQQIDANTMRIDSNSDRINNIMDKIGVHNGRNE